MVNMKGGIIMEKKLELYRALGLNGENLATCHANNYNDALQILSKKVNKKGKFENWDKNNLRIKNYHC